MHINSYNDEKEIETSRQFSKHQLATQNDGNEGNINSRNVAHKKMLDQQQQDLVINNLNSCLHDNFWVAYDALEPKNAHPLLVKGIEVAKDL